MVAQTPFEIDDRFLLQVYRLTTILALIAMPVLWAVYGLPAGLSFAIGSLLSLSAILSLEFIIRRMVKPGGWIGCIALGKYTIIFVGFYFLMKADWLNVYALAAGIGLVQVVIILKAIAMMIGILSKNNTTGTK